MVDRIAGWGDPPWGAYPSCSQPDLARKVFFILFFLFQGPTCEAAAGITVSCAQGQKGGRGAGQGRRSGRRASGRHCARQARCDLRVDG
eukprot:scaffold131400_cov18-Tisochrysis_lutea.AAC.1